MKNRLFVFLLISLFYVCAVSAQTNSKKNAALGKWKFEAPSAPEGYTAGIIVVSFTDNKYSSAISFAGNDYIIPGDKTKVENDSVTFVVFVEGNDVAVSLKKENDSKMTGKAVYSGGEIPLTLTKDIPKE